MLCQIHWGNGWNALQGRYQKLHAEDLAQQAAFAERMQWRDQQAQVCLSALEHFCSVCT